MNGPASIHQAVARVALTIGFAVTAAWGALAQTLAEPNRPTSSSPPPAATSAAKPHAKPCPQFGAGFIQIPGSDTCIKIGGFVEFEAGASRH